MRILPAPLLKLHSFTFSQLRNMKVVADAQSGEINR